MPIILHVCSTLWHNPLDPTCRVRLSPICINVTTWSNLQDMKIRKQLLEFKGLDVETNPPKLLRKKYRKATKENMHVGFGA